MSVRVAIVDDHKVCRVGLRFMLAEQGGFSVVGEADCVDSAVTLVSKEQPDVAVVDLRLGERSSVPALPRMLLSSPSTRVLILSMQDDPEAVREALAAGAHGYVNKAADAEEILGGVRAVAGGRSFLSVALKRAALDGIIDTRPPAAVSEISPPRAKTRPLSEREHEILQLFAIGHTHREIADRLGLRVKTIETYRSRLGDKFGVRSRDELVQCARALGLIGPRLRSSGT